MLLHQIFLKTLILGSLKPDNVILDTGELETVPVDSCKRSNVVEKECVKKSLCDELVKKVSAT